MGAGDGRGVMDGGMETEVVLMDVVGVECMADVGGRAL